MLRKLLVLAALSVVALGLVVGTQMWQHRNDRTCAAIEREIGSVSEVSEDAPDEEVDKRIDQFSRLLNEWIANDCEEAQR